MAHYPFFEGFCFPKPSGKCLPPGMGFLFKIFHQSTKKNPPIGILMEFFLGGGKTPFKEINNPLF